MNVDLNILSVTGATCPEGDIRLIRGANNYQGRVEVCHNNTWGTVCDNHWSSTDGIVACRQLGLGFISVTGNAYFKRGTEQIWLDNVTCTGSETRLTDCRHSGFGGHDCKHREVVGLICEGWLLIEFRNAICCTCSEVYMNF